LIQSDFAQVLIDSIAKGVSRLVDADMDETATRLKAEQTRQQLILQSLSIANDAPRQILQLFN
jgi:flagellin